MKGAMADRGNWTVIHRAPIWELELLRAALEEEGIPAVIPDATIKVIDPFATGDPSFDCTLQVQAAHALNARNLIEDLKASGPEALRAAQDEGLLPSDGVMRHGAGSDLLAVENDRELHDQARRLKEVEDIGRRIRWASLLGVTYPFALYYAFGYFSKIGKLGEKPRHHGLTMAALVFGLSVVAYLLVVFP